MGQFLALLGCSWGQSGGRGGPYGCDGIGFGGGKISVAQIVTLLRAMLSIDRIENNFPSLLRVPTASISSVAGLSSVRTRTRIASPDLAIATCKQFDG